MPRPGVLLDRDGVIIDPVLDPVDRRPESPLRAVDVGLATGAAEGLRLLRDAGLPLAVASNQPAAAKGKATVAALEAVELRTRELLEQAGLRLDGWYTCLHHPDGSVPELTRACDCRKPAPGLLLRAAEELDLDLARSWMVGDSDADREAARAAGARFALVEHPLSAHRRSRAEPADLRGPDLAAVAAGILRTLR